MTPIPIEVIGKRRETYDTITLELAAPEGFVSRPGQFNMLYPFGIVGLDWQDYVVVDPQFFRPAEVDYLCADITRARESVGWEPETTFTELVEEMVRADMAAHGLEV